MKFNLKTLKNPYFIISTILTMIIVGFFLRLSYVTASDLWYDEAFSGILVRQEWGKMFEMIIADKFHPPLYYVLLKLWVSITSLNDFNLRIFSVFFGTALIPSTFFVLKNLVSVKSGLIGAFIITISPFFINFSAEVRSYAMLCLVGSFSLIVFHSFYKKYNSNKLRKKDWYTLFAVCVALLLTHYLSIFFIFGFAIVCLSPKKLKLLFTLVGIFIVGLISISLFNKTESLRVIPRELTHTGWLPDARISDLPELGYSFLFGVDRQVLGELKSNESGMFLSSMEIKILLVLLLTLSITYLYFVKKYDSFLIKLLIANLLMIVPISLLGMNFFLERYMILQGLLFIYIIAEILSKFDYKKVGFILFLLLFIIINIKQNFSNPHYASLAEDLVITQNDFDNIVIKNPMDFLVMKYYSNGRIENLRIMYQPNDTFHNWPFFETEDLVPDTSNKDLVIEKL